jgi:hypothetical protein
MRTSTLHVPSTRHVPVHCVLYVPHDERQGPGMIHTLSMNRCHLESRVEVCPGMIVSLYLILPNAPQDIAIETAIVTWARQGEFGIHIQHLQPAEAHHLREYLMTQVD